MASESHRRLVLASMIIQLGERNRIVLSDLRRKVCPFCSNTDCCYHCEGSTNQGDSTVLETADDVAGRLKYNGALAGIEALTLACAVVGIDVQSKAFEYALQSAVEAVGNNTWDGSDADNTLEAGDSCPQVGCGGHLGTTVEDGLTCPECGQSWGHPDAE